MMKHELVERLQALNVPLPNGTIGDGDYKILEDWYYFLDFDKGTFAKLIAAVRMETLIVHNKRPKLGNKAIDEYQKREEYKRNKLKLEALRDEVQQLTENIKRFEKSQVY